MNLAKFSENRIVHQHRPEGWVGSEADVKLRQAQAQINNVKYKLKDRVLCNGNAQIPELRRKLDDLTKKRAEIRQNTKGEFFKEVDKLSKEILDLDEAGCEVTNREKYLPQVEEPEAATDPNFVADHPVEELQGLDKRLRAMGAEFGLNVYLDQLRDADDDDLKLSAKGVLKFFDGKKIAAIRSVFARMKKEEPDLLKFIGRESGRKIGINAAEKESAMLFSTDSTLFLYFNDKIKVQDFYKEFSQKILHDRAAAVVRGPVVRGSGLDVWIYRGDDEAPPDYWQIIEKWGPKAENAVFKLRTAAPKSPGAKAFEKFKRYGMGIVFAFGEENYKSAVKHYREHARLIVIDAAEKSPDKIYTEILKGIHGREKERENEYEIYSERDGKIFVGEHQLGLKNENVLSGLALVGDEKTKHLKVTVNTIKHIPKPGRTVVERGQEDVHFNINKNGDVIFLDKETGEKYVAGNLHDTNWRLDLVQRVNELVSVRFSGERIVEVTESITNMPGKPKERKIKKYYVLAVGEVPLGDAEFQKEVSKGLTNILSTGELAFGVGNFAVMLDQNNKAVLIANSGEFAKGGVDMTVDSLIQKEYGAKLAELRKLAGGKAIEIAASKAEFLIAFEGLKKALTANAAKLKATKGKLSLLIDTDKKLSFKDGVRVGQFNLILSVNSNDISADLANDLQQYDEYKATVEGRDAQEIKAVRAPQKKEKATNDLVDNFALTYVYPNGWELSGSLNIRIKGVSNAVVGDVVKYPETGMYMCKITLDGVSGTIYLPPFNGYPLGVDDGTTAWLGKYDLKSQNEDGMMSLTIEVAGKSEVEEKLQELNNKTGIDFKLWNGPKYDYANFLGDNGYLYKLEQAVKMANVDQRVAEGLKGAFILVNKREEVQTEYNTKKVYQDVVDCSGSIEEIAKDLSNVAYGNAVYKKLLEMDTKTGLNIFSWRSQKKGKKEMFAGLGNVETNLLSVDGKIRKFLINNGVQIALNSTEYVDQKVGWEGNWDNGKRKIIAINYWEPGKIKEVVEKGAQDLAAGLGLMIE